MIHLLIALALPHATPTEAVPPWAAAIVKEYPALPSPELTRSARAGQRAEPIRSRRADGSVLMFPPEVAAQIAEIEVSRAQIYRLLRSGDGVAAYSLATVTWAQNMNVKEFTFNSYVDAAEITGHNREAKRAIASMLLHPWCELDRPLLMLSLAAAQTGEIYPGQDEFCLAHQAHYYKLAHGGDYHGKTPSSSARRVVFDSALALGLEGGPAGAPYLEIAPGNRPR